MLLSLLLLSLLFLLMLLLLLLLLLMLLLLLLSLLLSYSISQSFSSSLLILLNGFTLFSLVRSVLATVSRLTKIFFKWNTKHGPQKYTLQMG